MGDIDVLVHKENMEQVGEILRTLGYEKTDSGISVWTYRKGSVSYEVHSSLVSKLYWNKVDYESYFLNLFNKWKLAGTDRSSRRCFSAEDHFIFLCFHLAKHLSDSGAGIRMFMDIALYLMTYQKKMDWSYIRQECEKIELAVFMQKILFVCGKWFQIDILYKTKQVDPVTLDQLKEYVLAGGIFGFERDESLRRLRKGIKDPSSSNSMAIKIRALWKIAFPDRKHMADFMTDVVSHPILLPAAWCRRWKLGLQNRWKMKAAVHNMNANVDEAKAQYMLLKKVGL